MELKLNSLNIIKLKSLKLIGFHPLAVAAHSKLWIKKILDTRCLAWFLYQQPSPQPQDAGWRLA